MNTKILIAVDDTKSTREIFAKCTQMCKCMAPEEIVLLYVEQYGGRSILDDLMGEQELSALTEVIEGTEWKEALDKKAEKILGYYKTTLEQNAPVPLIKTMVRSGIPAEEIVQTAKDEDVSIILIGSRSSRPSSFLMGSVSREVANIADRPVMIVK
jgi:nucleotide-binding universal stress UspA family protein